jgi:hypothetical protein
MKNDGKEADNMGTLVEISSHPRFKPAYADQIAAYYAGGIAMAGNYVAPERKRPTREEAIKRIKAGLEKRSGKRWSVTGGRGTAWGWLSIDALPKDRTWAHKKRDESLPGLPGDYVEYDTGRPASHMSPARREELGKLLGLTGPAHIQGVSIPSGGSYWDEYIERAETGKSDIKSTPYWD